MNGKYILILINIIAPERSGGASYSETGVSNDLVFVCLAVRWKNGRNTQIKLERTRGAGAPEVLRRETVEEEFRLRRNQPLNMAPSAPKDRYSQADFFCATFSKKLIFLGVPESELEFGKC